MNTTFNPNDPYALQQLQYKQQTQAGTPGNASNAGNSDTDPFGGMDINALLEQMNAGGDSFGGGQTPGSNVSGGNVSDNLDLYNVGGTGTAALAPAPSGQISTSSKPQTAPNAFQLYGSASDAAAYYPNPNTPVTTSADTAVTATNSATPATAVKFGSDPATTPVPTTPPADTKIPLSPEVKGKANKHFSNWGNALIFKKPTRFEQSPYLYAAALGAAGFFVLPLLGPIIGAGVGLLGSIFIQPGAHPSFLRLDRRYLKDNDKIKNAVDNAAKDDKDGEKARTELTKFRDSLVGTMKALYDVEYKAENNPLLDPATPGAITSESQANTVLHESYEALKPGGRKAVYKGDNKDFAQNVVLKLLAALDYKDTTQADAKTVFEKLQAKTAIAAPATPPAETPTNKTFVALLAENATITAEEAKALQDGPLKDLKALDNEFAELAKTDLKEEDRKTATTNLLTAIEAQHAEKQVQDLVTSLADEQLKTLAETTLTIPNLVTLAKAEQAKRVEDAKTDEERIAPLQAELDKAVAEWDKIQATVTAKAEAEFKTAADAAIKLTQDTLATAENNQTTIEGLPEANTEEQQAKKTKYEGLKELAEKVKTLKGVSTSDLEKIFGNSQARQLVNDAIRAIETDLKAITPEAIAKIKEETKRNEFTAKINEQTANVDKAKAYVKVYTDANGILTAATTKAQGIITAANTEIERLGKLLTTPEEEAPAAEEPEGDE